MSEPNKDGTDIMMALLMGLSGPRSSKAWNESQQIKAESLLTMAEHWINQTAAENARLKAEVERLTAFTTRTIIPNEELQAQVERLTKAGDAMLSEWASGEEKDAKNFLKALVIWNAAKEDKPGA
jgi:hypothetical protein